MAYSGGRTVAFLGELITLEGPAKRLSLGYGEGHPSERSGLPTIAIVGAINCRHVAIVSRNSAAPVLAKDSHRKA
jgi:hypothetical protein